MRLRLHFELKIILNNFFISLNSISPDSGDWEEKKNFFLTKLLPSSTLSTFPLSLFVDGWMTFFKENLCETLYPFNKQLHLLHAPLDINLTSSPNHFVHKFKFFYFLLLLFSVKLGFCVNLYSNKQRCMLYNK